MACKILKESTETSCKNVVPYALINHSHGNFQMWLHDRISSTMKQTHKWTIILKDSLDITHTKTDTMKREQHGHHLHMLNTHCR